MLGVGTARMRQSIDDKYVFISHMLMSLSIPNLSFNTVDKSIDVSIDRNDDLSMARVQRVLNYANSDQSIRVNQRQLKTNPNIIYSMTFDNRKLA